jgi:hypothetical protein
MGQAQNIETPASAAPAGAKPAPEPNAKDKA